MYVCLCKGITDSQLRAAIKDGGSEFKRLKKELAVGTQCGKCVPVAMSILAEETAKNAVYYEVA
ncbi:bacterioferritin-associated ferredoxin [Oceanisphaera pacifica]|uniref:Bacterioferritin-associated ferredoxin n=1 Tax=Oceanisphaera pacifica TaxID=2818389 RepID=A0ABS3NCT2_9GAMM|nr:bacterioferritin-associated ferredoxin [Oceanisphaera pacifica]MBO1518277.1 bacterioferritin-associated ferredoxin [Oceanisphaera pacifica]